MNTLLETHEIETGANPSISIIWLHGLGADGFDFAPIVPELVRSRWPAIRFIFPHAPVRAVTINNGVRMRAWYDIKSFDFNQRADEIGVRESMAQIEALIARENERGIQRIYRCQNPQQLNLLTLEKIRQYFLRMAAVIR